MRDQRFVKLFVLGLAICGGASQASAQLGSGIVSNVAANRLGLERTWSTQLQVDPSRGRVLGVKVEPGLLLAHTSLGTVQALDPESGRTLWSASVGRSAYETTQPCANDKFVAVTNGSTLFLLDRKSGGMIWQQRIGGSPSTGPAISAEKVFVSLATGLVEAYNLTRSTRSDELPVRYSGRQGAVAPPIVAGNRLQWTVPRGYLYSREVSSDLVQYRFQMDDDASTPPAHMSPFAFAASRAGTVYGLDDITGAEVWRYSIGASISHPILTIDGVLLAVSEQGAMARLNPRNGLQVWFQRGVADILSVGSGRIYALDTFGRLAAYDLAGGRSLGAIPLPTNDLPVHNSVTDRVYLATSTGLLQCLRETGLAKPLVHAPGFAIPPKPQPGAAPAAPADATAPPAEGAAPAAPAGAPGNPFGGT